MAGQVQGNQVSKLYIWGFYSGMDEHTLRDHLQKGDACDSLMEVIIYRDARQRSLMKAVACFSSLQDAVRTREAMAISSILGETTHFSLDEITPQMLEADVYYDLYVGNLSSSTTEQELLENFAVFGRILGAKMKKNSNGFSRNFGSVEFECSEDGFKAMKALDGSSHGESVWTVDKEKSQLQVREEVRHNMDEGRILYVSNLNYSVTEVMLWNYFTRFGQIKRCTLRKTSEGLSQGDAYITFSNKNGADSALEVNGESLWNRTTYVSRARSKPAG